LRQYGWSRRRYDAATNIRDDSDQIAARHM
jgi:hypothetical protein